MRPLSVSTLLHGIWDENVFLWIKERALIVERKKSPPRQETAARKKTSTCAVSALLRTRINQGVPQGRFLDPTTKGGLASPDRAIGSQRILHRFAKRIAGSRTLQRFVWPLPAAQWEFTTRGRSRQVGRKRCLW